MHVGEILRNKSPCAVTFGSNETVGIAAGLTRASNVGALVVRNVSRSGDAAVVGMFGRDDSLVRYRER